MGHHELSISLPLEPGVRLYLDSLQDSLARTVRDFTYPSKTAATSAALRQLESVRGLLATLLADDDAALLAVMFASDLT